MPDKRKYKRIQMRHPLICSGTTPGVRRDDGVAGYVVDICPSGLMIETRQPMAQPMVALIADIGGGVRIEATGKRIYCRQHAAKIYRSGIQIGGSIRQSSQFTNEILKCYFT